MLTLRPRDRARRLAVLALLAVLAPTLMACSGDDATQPPPTSTPTLMPRGVATPAAAASAPASAATGEDASTAAMSSTNVVGDPRPAPPLDDLVTSDGSAFTLAELAGHPSLVFFGYTHCPDVCPTTIGQLFNVLEADPEARAVFVSVDPERDTVEFLQAWTEYFPESFVAVTGPPGAIRRAAEGYGVRYARVETTARSGYTMSHTADVFLIDPEGQLRLTYPFGTDAETMIADISRLSTG